MLAFALLPLTVYFIFLTVVQFRRRPTLFSGSVDFALLAWGLFGLATLGLGKFIIPIYVFSAWGLMTWFFWTCFYFTVTYSAAGLFRSRIVIYHVRREIVLPAMFDLARQIDPKAEWCGNVLSLHGLGLQWTVTGDPFGSHLLFTPTGYERGNPHIDILREKFAGLCRTLPVPPAGIRWLFPALAAGLAAVAAADIYCRFSDIIRTCGDYWLPFFAS
jgi:hypothetical protein